MLVLFIALAVISLFGLVFYVSDRIANYYARRALKRRVYRIFQ